MSAKKRPPGSAAAAAEIQSYYNYLRQRAAEKPLQTIVLSRVGKQVSDEEKDRWRKNGEFKRNNLTLLVNTLISALESEPRIGAHTKLSIVKTVWSIMQVELSNTASIIALGSIATKKAIHTSSTQKARNGRQVDRKTFIMKSQVDDYLTGLELVGMAQCSAGRLCAGRDQLRSGDGRRRTFRVRGQQNWRGSTIDRGHRDARRAGGRG
jgi:hypothetical protein